MEREGSEEKILERELVLIISGYKNHSTVLVVSKTGGGEGDVMCASCGVIL